MNTPVTFEIAKLLKEKEYEGETSSKEYRSLYYNIVDEKLHTWEYFQAFKNMLKAPSIAQVIMWLYKKHGIWIYPYQCGMDYFCYNIQGKGIKNSSLKNSYGGKNDTTGMYYLPSEAYLAAIEYTLKNLI